MITTTPASVEIRIVYFRWRQLEFTDNPLLLVNGAEPTISRCPLRPSSSRRADMHELCASHISREWAWFQRSQRTRPQRLRDETTAHFFEILIAYFIYLAAFLIIEIGLGG